MICRRGLLVLALAAGCGDNVLPGDLVDPRCGEVVPAPNLMFTEIALANDEVGVTGMAFVPDRDELLVLERSGRISHYRIDAGGLALLGSFQLPSVRSTGDCGLMSVAFDPIVSDRRYLYASHCVPGMGGRGNRIIRVEFDPSDYDGIAASAVTVFDLFDPDIRSGARSHNIGRILFDSDGLLWVPVGDRGVKVRAQDLESPLGSLLRIEPLRTPGIGGYTPAQDNPFAGDPERNPDIYAYGLRNPWTATLDDLGRIWMGNVGSDKIEEIEVVTAPGQNLGWAEHEGPCLADCDSVDPVFHWTRSSGHRYVQADPDAVPTTSRVAWVGPQVHAAADDPYGGALDGAVLFGDYCVGFLRAARLSSDGVVCLDQHVGHKANVTDMRQGPDGFLYAVTFGKCSTADDELVPGRLWRVVPAP